MKPLNPSREQAKSLNPSRAHENERCFFHSSFFALSRNITVSKNEIGRYNDT